MILIDANILIYAYNPQSDHHVRAKKWLEEVFSQPEPIWLAWPSILAFLRIVTNIHAFEKPILCGLNLTNPDQGRSYSTH